MWIYKYSFAQINLYLLVSEIINNNNSYGLTKSQISLLFYSFGSLGLSNNWGDS